MEVVVIGPESDDLSDREEPDPWFAALGVAAAVVVLIAVGVALAAWLR